MVNVLKYNPDINPFSDLGSTEFLSFGDALDHKCFIFTLFYVGIPNVKSELV